MYLCEYINGFLLWNEKQLPSVLDTRELQLPSIWDNAPVPVTLGVSTPPVSQTPADHDYPVFQIPGSCNSPVSQIPRSCNSRCPAHRGVDLLLFRLFSQTSSPLYLLTLKQQSIKNSVNLLFTIQEHLVHVLKTHYFWSPPWCHRRWRIIRTGDVVLWEENKPTSKISCYRPFKGNKNNVYTA